MAEQTFTIHINKGEADSDFFRVDCKRVETCKKYLKSWYEQGKRWGNLYNFFYREGATYTITRYIGMVRDGEVVASGLMEEFAPKGA